MLQVGACITLLLLWRGSTPLLRILGTEEPVKINFKLHLEFEQQSPFLVRNFSWIVPSPASVTRPLGLRNGYQGNRLGVATFIDERAVCLRRCEVPLGTDAFSRAFQPVCRTSRRIRRPDDRRCAGNQQQQQQRPPWLRTSGSGFSRALLATWAVPYGSSL